MVKLHIKHADESQFLVDTTVETTIDDLISNVAAIYNGRLKIHRICAGNLKKKIIIHPHKLGDCDSSKLYLSVCVSVCLSFMA